MPAALDSLWFAVIANHAHKVQASSVGEAIGLAPCTIRRADTNPIGTESL